jgi:hypothetical protein
VILVAVGQRARIELARYTNNSYFLDTGNRTVLGEVPRNSGPVALEGYGETYQAQAEEPLVSFLSVERLGNRTTLPTAISSGPGLAYLTFYKNFGPWPPFNPNYSYVLTRLGGVKTSRRVISRDGPFALETRARPLDVFSISGLLTAMARLDPGGTPWAQAWAQPPIPMAFYVTGSTSAKRVWARLTFATSEPVTVPSQRGVSARTQGHLLTACVLATGTSPLRLAKLSVSAAPLPGPIPKGLFPPPVPPEGVSLMGMRAVVGSCSP